MNTWPVPFLLRIYLSAVFIFSYYHRLPTGASVAQSAADLVRALRMQQHRPLPGAARQTDLQLYQPVRGQALPDVRRVQQSVQQLLQEQWHLPAGRLRGVERDVRADVCVRRRMDRHAVRTATELHRGVRYLYGQQFHQRVHVRHWECNV